MNTVLKEQGWEIVQTIAQDASARRYYRIAKGRDRAVLMEMGEERATLGQYIKIAGWLNSIGLKAPEIYEADESAGYALIEDFGDTSFRKAIAQGQAAKDIYGLASEVLGHLRAQKNMIALPDYHESNVHKGRRRIVDWYVPAVLGGKNPDGLVESYLAAWQEIENSLSPCPRGFIHGDYHLENLMLIHGAKGAARCGILDFQGAMTGPAPYDTGNLLEDARADVPPAIREGILGRHDEEFCLWYRVLATQFHCRVIGQFIKMAVEGEKPQYLPHVPRLAFYIGEALQSPVLAPLKRWFAEHKVGFDAAIPPVETIRTLIRPDAF